MDAHFMTKLFLSSLLFAPGIFFLAIAGFVGVLVAMEKAGVKAPPAPGPGETAMGLRYAHPLQALWARLVTASGPYPQPMLIDQVSNIARMIGGADQRPGKDALERYNDVTKELAAIQAEVDKLAGSK